MPQSETIGKLGEALAKAQAEIKAPAKGKTAQIPGKDGKPGYRYSYADLADVIDCYRGPLTKHGLSIVQPIEQRDGHLLIVTKLVHSSGEWLASEYPLKVYDRPQEQGSAITYARRYAVSSLLGIAAEDDDDGERAQHATPQPQKQAAPPPAPKPPSGDAQAILDLALKISAETGESVETIIKDASRFEVDGKEKWFTDPAKVSSLKWLGKTRRNLEETLKYNSSPPQLDSADPDDVVPF